MVDGINDATIVELLKLREYVRAYRADRTSLNARLMFNSLDCVDAAASPPSKESNERGGEVAQG